MADPSTPTPTVTPFIPTSDQQQAIDNYTQKVKDNASAQGDLDSILGSVRDVMNNLSKKFTEAGMGLDNLTTLTEQQITQFSVLTTGVIKAREAFTGLTGVDFSGLATFKDTVSDIREALASGGTAAADMMGAVESLGKSLISMGVPQTVVNEAWKKGAGAVVDLAAGIMTHADNMLRAQTAYVQMTAAVGGLDVLWNAAGDSLERLNDITQKQTMMIGDTIEATGLSSKQVEAYYGELGQIPGALTSIVNTSEKGGEATSMLTAAIQVATGTGRSYKDVMTDLKTAFKEYGLVGENALKFSVRMSDVSSSLKAPIDDVTSSLRNSAHAFQMFATGQESAASSAESLSKTLNEYGKALESTGLSATAAVEVAGNLSNQVAKLSVGQLAFISQRTGGAGGLMGAAQETLKLQTDPGAVVADAMKTLQQQFGKIVTVQEAATSEAAANQNMKQTLMLQQLLGPLAKDQATANRLLEAMKNQAAGQPGAIAKALSPTSVQTAEDRGLKLQQGSYSELTKIRGHIARLQYLADQGVGRTVQETLTPRATGTTPKENLMKDSLANAMIAKRAAGGEQVSNFASGLSGGNVENSLGRDMQQVARDTISTIKDIPDSLKPIINAIKEAASSGDQDALKAQQQDLQQRKRDAEESLKMTKGNTDAQRKALSEIMGANKILEAMSPFKNSNNTNASNAVLTGGVGSESPPLTSHERIATAIQRATAHPSTTTNTGTTAAVGAAPNAKNNETTINLVGKFTMDCPHCGKPADISNQAKIYPQQFIAQH